MKLTVMGLSLAVLIIILIMDSLFGYYIYKLVSPWGFVPTHTIVRLLLLIVRAVHLFLFIEYLNIRAHALDLDFIFT